LCSHKGLLPKLVARLKEMDFLTEDLLVGPSHSAEETDHGVDTYFGLCKYPGRELRHRIDFKVDPMLSGPLFRALIDAASRLSLSRWILKGFAP
jgi:hypothetical protein